MGRSRNQGTDRSCSPCWMYVVATVVIVKKVDVDRTRRKKDDLGKF